MIYLCCIAMAIELNVGKQLILKHFELRIGVVMHFLGICQFQFKPDLQTILIPRI
jgi:hypothetical protein